MFQVSLTVNCGCIIVAVVSACLITVDLAYWNREDDLLLRVRPCKKIQKKLNSSNCLFSNRYYTYSRM